MDFTRKKKRGMNGKTHRVWLSSCGQYRISWRREVFGVAVAPHYHACVRCYAEPRGDRRFWHFVGRRGSYKKLSAAIEACEKHEKLWKNAIEISEGERTGRADRLRLAVSRSKVGTGVTCQTILNTLPAWVRKHGKLVNQLFPVKSCREPSQDDPTETSPTTDQEFSSSSIESDSSSPSTPTAGPALSAEAKAESTTRTTRRARSKATSSATESPVQNAETGASTKGSSRRRITRSSPSTSKRKGSTKRSPKPRKQRSAS